MEKGKGTKFQQKYGFKEKATSEGKMKKRQTKFQREEGSNGKGVLIAR